MGSTTFSSDGGVFGRRVRAPPALRCSPQIFHWKALLQYAHALFLERHEIHAEHVQHQRLHAQRLRLWYWRDAETGKQFLQAESVRLVPLVRSHRPEHGSLLRVACTIPNEPVPPHRLEVPHAQMQGSRRRSFRRASDWLFLWRFAPVGQTVRSWSGTSAV